MRIEGSVTSLSWIPSEAVRGGTRVAFDAGFTHYDEPPPDVIEDIEVLRTTDRFRFANVLAAWAEFDGSGRVADCGYAGGGLMGSTTVALAGLRRQFEAVALPDLQAPAEVGEGWVRFTQTAGGRTGIPAPRRVRRRPYIQWQAPLVWSTLSLTLHADRSPKFEVLGASRFPRRLGVRPRGASLCQVGAHRLPRLVPQVVRQAHPLGRPGLAGAGHRGGDGSRALVVGRPHGSPQQAKIPQVARRRHVGHRGEEGSDVFLVLDGVVRVEKDGERLAEYGPGAILGERSGLEGGRRTSTLVAVTPCRVAAVAHSAMDPDQLRELSKGHGAADTASG